MDNWRIDKVCDSQQFQAWCEVKDIVIGTTNLILVISVVGEDSRKFGQTFLSEIESIENISLEKAYNLSESWVEKCRLNDLKISFVLGLFKDNKVGWLAGGFAQIILRRDEKFGYVIAPSLEIQAKLGKHHPDEDVIILATQNCRVEIEQTHLLLEKGYQPEGVVKAIEMIDSNEQGRALAILSGANQANKNDLQQQEFEMPDSPILHPELNTSPDSINEVSKNHKSFQQNFHKTINELHDDNDAKESSSSQTNMVDLKVELESTEFVESTDSKMEADSSRKINIISILTRIGIIAKRLLRFIIAGISKLFNDFILLMKALLLKKQIHKKSDGLATNVSEISSNIETSSVYGNRKSGVFFQHKKKLIIIFIISLILILIFALSSIGYQIWQDNLEAEAQIFVNDAKTKFLQAQELSRLDPVRGREQLEIALADARALQTQATPGSTNRSAVDTLINEIELKLQEIMGTAQREELPVWLNLQDKKSGFVASKIDSSPKGLFIFDDMQLFGYSIDFLSGAIKEFTLENLAQTKDLSIQSEENILFLAQGIKNLNLTSNEVSELKPEGDSNRAANLIGSYANFVYVFNPEKRNIYRYAQREPSLSDPIGWLVSPLGLTSESIVDMAVDGDVWLSTKNGEVKKYTSGRESNFQLSQLPEPLAGPIFLETDTSFTNLYLFAPSQGRVVIVTKEGIFVTQVKSPVLAGATGIGVDEEGKTIYAVSGSVIYKIPIN